MKCEHHITDCAVVLIPENEQELDLLHLIYGAGI